MSKRLEELNRALKAKCEALVETMDKADGETSPTEEELKSYQENVSGLEVEIKTLRDQADAEEKAVKALGMARGEIVRLGEPLRTPTFGGSPDGAAAMKSFGACFADTEAYKSWIAQNAPGGRVPDATGGGRLPASAPIPLDRSLKAVVQGISTWANPGNTSGNALVVPQFQGIVDQGIYQIPLGIADIVQHIPIQTDVIFYVQVDTGTAAITTPIPEATGTSDASAAKPEGALTFKQGTALVRTIPVWIPVTRQAMAASPSVATTIDNYLRYEVQRALTKEIIQGDGTGEHFLGVLHLANLLSQAFSGDILTTARKSITNLLLNGRTMPNAWVMHPTDWETFDLTADDEARYYFGGPRDPGAPRLWGVPVRQTEFVPLGNPILADWDRYVVADREGTTVRVSDSHADFFSHNLLAILAECRAAGYAERDQAFLKMAMS